MLILDFNLSCVLSLRKNKFLTLFGSKTQNHDFVNLRCMIGPNKS